MSDKSIIRARRRAPVALSQELRASSPTVRVRGATLESLPRASSSQAASPPRASSSALDGLLDDDRTESVASDVREPLPDRELPFLAPALCMRPPQPVTTGFDRLDYSITQLLERLPPAPLRDKFDTISQWLDKFSIDVVPHRVAKLLRSVLEAGDAVEPPQKHAVLSHMDVLGSCSQLAASTMTACFALNQLLLVLGRAQPTLAPVCDVVMSKLLSAVYRVPPRHVSRTIIDTMHDGSHVRSELEAFKGRMHFQESKDAQKRLTAVEQFVLEADGNAERQRKVMTAAVSRWQSRLLSVSFKAWRRVVHDTRKDTAQTRHVAQLESKIARLEEQLRGVQSTVADRECDIEQLRADLDEQARTASAAAKAQVFELHHRDKQLAGRDAMIDALERDVANLKAAADAAAAAAEAKHLQVLEAVRRFVQRQRTISQDLLTLRTAVAAVVDSESADTPFVPSAGDPDHVVAWANKVLDHFEDDVPRLTSLLPSAACLDAVMAVLGHVDTRAAADPALAEARASATVSALSKALVRWCRRAEFPLAESFNDASFCAEPTVASALLALVLSHAMVACVAPSFAPRATRSTPPQQPNVALATTPEDIELALDETAAMHQHRLVTAGRIHFNTSSLLAGALTTVAAAGSRGAQGLSADEKHDQSAFAITHQALSDRASRDDVEDIQELIQRNYPTLRLVFLYYCGADGDRSVHATGMTAADFHRMLCDCGAVVPGKLDRAFVTDRFSHSTLDARRWIAALVECSTILRGRDVPVVATCQAFLESHVLPFARRHELALATRPARSNTALSTALSDCRTDLFKVFRAFCLDSANPNKMPLEGLKTLAVQAGLSPVRNVTEAMVERYFNWCRPTVSDNGISFDGFLNVLCCLSHYVETDPLMTPVAKARAVVFERVLASFKTKLKLAYVVPDADSS